MPEENWAAHGGTPACDLCHSRKVKCDRRDPCAACVASKADCLRTRQKQKSRPKPRIDETVRALVQQVSALERAVGHGPVTHSPRNTQNMGAGAQSQFTADLGVTARPSKRRLNGELVVGNDMLPSLESNSEHQKRGDEGLSFILNELSHNSSLADYQRSVLQTAIAFISQLSQAPSTAVEHDLWAEKVPTDFTQSELVQIIVAHQSDNIASVQVQLHSLDHIPPKTLERMALGLLENKADARILTMYKVVVHFKAALSLYASQLQGPMNLDVKHHVKKMQLHHLNAALTALDGVSFLTPPSLLLLQTLLAGAVLMHIIGNSTACWGLTAHASRTLVALGFHNMNNLDPNLTRDERHEINVAVAWCYHFDRLMSLLLLRPPSLPPLDIAPSSLMKHDPRNPMSIFAKVMLDMVPIHERILDLTLEGVAENARAPDTVGSDVESLKSVMMELYATMEEARPVDLASMDANYLLHWYSIEFKYFTTLTSVYRLSPTVASSAEEREQCLGSARRALSYVKEIQQLGKAQAHFVEDYSPYLSWTILSYPPTPIFVLFCNVVCISDAGDFQILQEVADSISSLVVEHKYADKLKRLCHTLLAVCRPMLQTGHASHHPTLGIANRSTQAPLGSSEASAVDTDGKVPAPIDTDPIHWEDDLMKQLFQCQPSLNWLDSDILDPALWDTNSELISEAQCSASN